MPHRGGADAERPKPTHPQPKKNPTLPTVADSDSTGTAASHDGAAEALTCAAVPVTRRLFKPFQALSTGGRCSLFSSVPFPSPHQGLVALCMHNTQHLDSLAHPQAL